MIDQVIQRGELVAAADLSPYDDLRIGISPHGTKFALFFCRPGTDFGVTLSDQHMWTLFSQMCTRLVTAPLNDRLTHRAREQTANALGPQFDPPKKKRPKLVIPVR